MNHLTYTTGDHYNMEKKLSQKREMSPYFPQLVYDMETLAERLIPSAEYLREVKEAAYKIFEILKQEGPLQNIKIGRTKVAGSTGKRTGISYFNHNGEIINADLDLAVYINDLEPPFQGIYDVFEELLMKLGIVSNMKKTKYSLQFKIGTPSYGDIDVDLLAAENHVKDTSPWDGYEIAEVQAAFALQQLNEIQMKAIKENNCVDLDAIKLTGSAFSEKTVNTIRNFVCDNYKGKVVRLAKYWIHMIDLVKYNYIPGKSCMIEMIAIHAQLIKNRKVEHGTELCLVSGFQRFLEAVSKLSILDISLDKDTNNSYHDRLRLYSTPMIRDPGNCWNNLAKGFPQEAVQVLEQQAKKTLNLLQKVRTKDGYYQYKNSIDEIFIHKK